MSVLLLIHVIFCTVFGLNIFISIFSTTYLYIILTCKFLGLGGKHIAYLVLLLSTVFQIKCFNHSACISFSQQIFFSHSAIHLFKILLLFVQISQFFAFMI